MTGHMITGHRDTETQRTFGHVVCVGLCVAGAIESVPTLCCVCSSHPLAISGAGMPAGGGRSEHAAASPRPSNCACSMEAYQSAAYGTGRASYLRICLARRS